MHRQPEVSQLDYLFVSAHWKTGPGRKAFGKPVWKQTNICVEKLQFQSINQKKKN